MLALLARLTLQVPGLGIRIPGMGPHPIKTIMTRGVVHNEATVIQNIHKGRFGMPRLVQPVRWKNKCKKIDTCAKPSKPKKPCPKKKEDCGVHPLCEPFDPCPFVPHCPPKKKCCKPRKRCPPKKKKKVPKIEKTKDPCFQVDPCCDAPQSHGCPFVPPPCEPKPVCRKVTICCPKKKKKRRPCPGACPKVKCVKPKKKDCD